MNGIMNENQTTIVKKHEHIKPFIHKMNSINHSCYRNFRTNILIDLNKDVFIILNLQILVITK